MYTSDFLALIMMDLPTCSFYMYFFKHVHLQCTVSLYIEVLNPSEFFKSCEIGNPFLLFQMASHLC